MDELCFYNGDSDEEMSEGRKTTVREQLNQKTEGMLKAR